MKKYLLFILAFLALGMTQRLHAQIEMNMPLLSTWSDSLIPTNQYGQYSDIWGYADSSGHEYAIIGAVNGTYFINITDATHPVLVSYQPGRQTTNVIHRDFKTYEHYAYAVCDEGNSSLQIFDLQYLPDSVVKVYDSQALVQTAHNIFISNGRLYLCGMKTAQGIPHTLDVLSLADPVNPTLISTLSSPMFDYVHDINIHNDTAFLSCGSNGLYIYDYTDPYNPQILASITQYPDRGYNHSSWVSENGKQLVFADETHGKGLKIYDISDIANPSLESVFRSNLLGLNPPDSTNGSIPHNPFIVGNDKLIVSYYHDGVEAFDISNPFNVYKIGYYDTYPENTNYSGYEGCWGVYPYLPSKHIIASDITHGLFVLDGSQVLGIDNPKNKKDAALVFPNPVKDAFSVMVSLHKPGKVNYSLIDVTGRLLLKGVWNGASGKNVYHLNVKVLAAGTYLLQLNSDGLVYSKKIIKM